MIGRRDFLVGTVAVAAAAGLPVLPASADPRIYVGMHRPAGTLRMGQDMDFVSEDPLTGVRSVHRVVVTRIRRSKRCGRWFELEGAGEARPVGDDEPLGLRAIIGPTY